MVWEQHIEIIVGVISDSEVCLNATFYIFLNKIVFLDQPRFLLAKE